MCRTVEGVSWASASPLTSCVSILRIHALSLQALAPARPHWSSVLSWLRGPECCSTGRAVDTSSSTRSPWWRHNSLTSSSRWPGEMRLKAEKLASIATKCPRQPTMMSHLYGTVSCYDLTSCLGYCGINSNKHQPQNFMKNSTTLTIMIQINVLSCRWWLIWLIL